MKLTFSVLVLASLAGCASFQNPIPEGYQGPVVLLADTGKQEDGGKGQFFAAVEIDGRPIENALSDTLAATQGMGFALMSQYTKREVPVIPMKVKLIGTHQTAAPIQEIASRVAGTFFRVEGVVDFLPQEGKRYMVTGQLKKDQSCVWIQENGAQAPATAQVCTK